MSSDTSRDSPVSLLKQPVKNVLDLLESANEVVGSSEDEIPILIDRVKAVVESMQQTESILKETLSKSEDKKTALEQAQASLEEEKTKVQQERSSISQERAALDQAKSTINSETSEAQARLESVRKDTAEAEKTVNSLHEQCDKVLGHLATLQSCQEQRDKVLDQLKTLQNSKADAEATAAKIKTQCEELEEQRAGLEQDLDGIRKNIHQHEEEKKNQAQQALRLAGWHDYLERETRAYKLNKVTLDEMKEGVGQQQADAISAEKRAEQHAQEARKALGEARLLDESNKEKADQIKRRAGTNNENQKRLQKWSDDLQDREALCREREKKIDKSFQQATTVDNMARRILFNFNEIPSLTIDDAVTNCKDTETLMFQEINALREKCHQSNVENLRLNTELSGMNDKYYSSERDLTRERQARNKLQSDRDNLSKVKDAKELALQREQQHTTFLQEQIKNLMDRLNLENERFAYLKTNGVKDYNQKMRAEGLKSKLAKERVAMLEEKLAYKEDSIQKNKELLMECAEDIAGVIDTAGADLLGDSSSIRRIKANHEKLINKVNLQNEAPEQGYTERSGGTISTDAAVSEADSQRQASAPLLSDHQGRSPLLGEEESGDGYGRKRTSPNPAIDGRETKRRALGETVGRTMGQHPRVDSRDFALLPQSSKRMIDCNRSESLIKKGGTSQFARDITGRSSPPLHRSEDQLRHSNNTASSPFSRARSPTSMLRSSVHRSIELDDSEMYNSAHRQTDSLDREEDGMRRSNRVRTGPARQNSSAQRSTSLMGPPNPRATESEVIERSPSGTATNLKVLSLQLAEIRGSLCRDLPGQLLEKLTSFVSVLDQKKPDWETAWLARGQDVCLRQVQAKKGTTRDCENMACYDCRTGGRNRLCLKLKGPGIVQLMPSGRQGQSENDEGYWLCV